MSGVDEYEGRIIAALEKISKIADEVTATNAAAEGAADSESQAGEIRELEAVLTSEREAIAELRTRLDRRKESHASDVERLAEVAAALKAQLAAQEEQIQQVMDSNMTLREASAKLRKRNLRDVGDTESINVSMEAELAALHATRAAEVAEMDKILGELKPLVEGDANA